MVQGEDTALACRKSEFDSRSVHSQWEGNRIGLGNWLLTSRPGNGVGGFDSPTFRFGSIVKRRSYRASNPVFQVQILVELLLANYKRKGNPIGDGTRLEAG